jgi:HEPN domain-containing protein
MKNSEQAREWLKRAKSNLAFARIGLISPDILYEDLCFNVQQPPKRP